MLEYLIIGLVAIFMCAGIYLGVRLRWGDGIMAKIFRLMSIAMGIVGVGGYVLGRERLVVLIGRFPFSDQWYSCSVCNHHGPEDDYCPGPDSGG